MKRATIRATFSELPAAHAELSGSAEKPSKSSAIQAALKNLLKNPHLKGKRYTNFTATVFVTDVTDFDDFSGNEEDES